MALDAVNNCPYLEELQSNVPGGKSLPRKPNHENGQVLRNKTMRAVITKVITSMVAERTNCPNETVVLDCFQF